VRVVIVGGGKVGGYLARELGEEGHAVTLIERSEALAERLGESLAALVLQGDGSSVDILEEAEVERADWVLAVTGLDEENLVACELAETLGAGRVLARLNDPRNRPTFDALGIPVVAVTDLIGEVISREIDIVDLERIALFGRGSLSLIEVDIHEGVPHRLVAELRLPSNALLVARIRGDEVEVPGARTDLLPGDRVLAVTTVGEEAAVRSALLRAHG
jgi:trk system potassium uptake protein TrkA